MKKNILLFIYLVVFLVSCNVVFAYRSALVAPGFDRYSTERNLIGFLAGDNIWTGYNIFQNVTIQNLNYMNVTGPVNATEYCFQNDGCISSWDNLTNSNISWNDLNDIPTGFADGIDNTSSVSLAGYFNSEANLTGLLDDNYVNVGGDTMTGNLNMSNNNLTNVKEVSVINSSYGMWSNSTDVVFGYIEGLG